MTDPFAAIETLITKAKLVEPHRPTMTEILEAEIALAALKAREAYWQERDRELRKWIEEQCGDFPAAPEPLK